MIEAIWTFLTDTENRAVLGWLGGGLVVVCGGLWTVFTFFVKRPGDGANGNTVRVTNGLSGWPLVALVGVLAGAVVLVAAFSGSNTTASDGGIAIGGNVEGSKIGTE